MHSTESAAQTAHIFRAPSWISFEYLSKMVKTPQETQMDKSNCYTVKQVASRWKVSEACIRNLYNNQELRIFRFGRTVRIPKEEVERIEREWIN